MKVSVIGTPGCGRTVFLGLLYETLVRMSTAEGDDIPEVVVNTGPVEAKALGDLRLELLSGRWPSPDLRSKVSGCTLDLGFRKDNWPFFRTSVIRKVRLENVPLGEKDLKVMRSSGQLREMLQGVTGGSIDRYGLSERFRDSLESEAFILLADVSLEAREGPWSIEERDAFLATVIDNASRTRLGKERRVEVLVVLTRADRAEADDKKLFGDGYPRTSKAMLRALPEGDGASRLFTSWLGTVPNMSGDQAPATTIGEGQVQIDYSEKEYRRLIALIGKIA
jgi:hypothetical protein